MFQTLRACRVTRYALRCTARCALLVVHCVLRILKELHFGLQMDCKRVGLQWIAEFQVFKTLSETSEFCRLQMYCRSDSIHLFDEIRSCTRRLRDGIEQETAIDDRNVERTHLVYKNQKIDGPSLNFNAFIHKIVASDFPTRPCVNKTSQACCSSLDCIL